MATGIFRQRPNNSHPKGIVNLKRFWLCPCFTRTLASAWKSSSCEWRQLPAGRSHFCAWYLAQGLSRGGLAAVDLLLLAVTAPGEQAERRAEVLSILA